MLRSTTWSIFTAHINSNEFGEDLIVIFAADVFASMGKGVLGSANGECECEWSGMVRLPSPADLSGCRGTSAGAKSATTFSHHSRYSTLIPVPIVVNTPGNNGEGALHGADLEADFGKYTKGLVLALCLKVVMPDKPERIGCRENDKHHCQTSEE